jgi:hypothetical protein
MHFKNEKESCDIYVGMNALKPEARTRTKEDIHTIRHLYLDIDHDGPAALAKIQQSNLVPLPNYTVNTSPDKFQVVWRVENVSPEQAEVLQRAMVRKFGGDPAATDSTRVLRLPGFLNRKYDTEFPVQAQKQTERVYHLQDFRLRTDPIESDFRPRHHSQTQASSESRPLSQSEHDWAYAKRALARGDDALEIPRCGLHAFRHSHTALLLDSGATPKVVQRQLRHADARTTLEIYGHVIGEAQRQSSNPRRRPSDRGQQP